MDTRPTRALCRSSPASGFLTQFELSLGPRSQPFLLGLMCSVCLCRLHGKAFGRRSSAVDRAGGLHQPRLPRMAPQCSGGSPAAENCTLRVFLAVPRIGKLGKLWCSESFGTRPGAAVVGCPGGRIRLRPPRGQTGTTTWAPAALEALARSV